MLSLSWSPPLFWGMPADPEPLLLGEAAAGAEVVEVVLELVAGAAAPELDDLELEEPAPHPATASATATAAGSTARSRSRLIVSPWDRISVPNDHDVGES